MEGEPLRIPIKPGLFTENTERRSLERWKDGDKVRFHKGLPQKLGGWEEEELTGGPIRGKARRIHEWQSLDRQVWSAVGTSSKLYLVNQGQLYDITPLRRQVTRTNPFTTTNGSPIVTVADVGHDAIQGDFVRFSGATAVGGLTLNGEYAIVTILGVDSYTVNAGANASSGATGGGTVDIQYDINNGGEDTGLYYGWGTCTWGTGTWGTARGACSSMTRNLRIWSLDNWGEDLIASPSGGAVYWWDRTLGPNSRAVVRQNAPLTNQRVLVSPQDRQLIALGAHDGSTPDPLLIKVSDRGNFDNFGPATAQNRVYTKRIDVGSKIITGFRIRRNTIIFTDVSVHLMQPVNGPLVFDVTQIAEKNSIIGPNAGVAVDGEVYLMGLDKFHYYDGVYGELVCEVWSKVFNDFNKAQADKVYAWYNSVFGEVWWHYPSALSNECDRLVVYNIDEEHWSHHTMDRTAGHDRGAPARFPYAIHSDGTFYFHESGTDDDTEAMDAFLESYDVMIGEGKVTAHMSRIIPDFRSIVGSLDVYLKTKKYPEASVYTTKGPYTFTLGTTVRGTRARGRLVAIRYESNDLGDHWRVGDFTYYAQADGER
jgi:hypothetical protein